MNYLAHARLHLDRPYFAAGTALPDWMNVIDRKNRARRQLAEPIMEDADDRIALFAAGCVMHHDDDRWFHQTAPFVTLSTRFAVEVRELLGQGLGHQSGFLGHIAVELLLDAVLIERSPDLLERYYDVLDSVDPLVVQQAANLICPRPVSTLSELIPRFIRERFLADYEDDHRLHGRLNSVMRRVRLPLLPESVIAWLGSARRVVRTHADELLAPPEEARS